MINIERWQYSSSWSSSFCDTWILYCVMCELKTRWYYRIEHLSSSAVRPSSVSQSVSTYRYCQIYCVIYSRFIQEAEAHDKRTDKMITDDTVSSVYLICTFSNLSLLLLYQMVTIFLYFSTLPPVHLLLHSEFVAHCDSLWQAAFYSLYRFIRPFVCHFWSPNWLTV